MMMVTLHEPDFRSLKVTVLQTADRGIILFFLVPIISEDQPNVNWLFGADGEYRTHDLFLTKEVRYHCATSAIWYPYSDSNRENFSF